MDVNTGEIIGLGSAPTFDPSVYTGTLSQSEYRSLTSEANERAADKPRHPGPVSDGLDLQADHRGRRARGGADRAQRAVLRRRQLPDRRPSRSTTRSTPSYGSITMEDALRVSSDVFFYELGRRSDNAGRRGDPGLGLPARARRPDRDRSAVGVRRPDPDTGVARTSSTRRSSPTVPGASATTSTSRSGRATSR